MRKFVVALFGFAALVIAPSAQAGSPAFNWTGFYVGLDAGGLWGRANVADDNLACCTGSASPKGFIGGGHIGYRGMIQQFVVGVEGDFWGVANGEDVSANPDIPLIDKLRVKSGGSLRLQAGVPFDRTLVYLTGGISFANVDGCIDVPGGPCTNGSTGFSGTRTGWIAGIGAEYAMMANWSARLEYLHADYGSHDYSATAFIPPSVIGLNNFTTDVVRFGASYKFGN